jgi:L-threonylcarbamoyladenylate synthase
MSPVEVIGLHQRDRLRGALRDDGVVVIPHFGGYKLAALLDRAAAVRLLLDIAGPPAEGNDLTCVVGRQQQAMSLTSDWDIGAQRLTERMWPGPLTIVVLAAEHVVAAVGDHDDELRLANASTGSVRTVCDEVGPLLTVDLVGVHGGPIETADEAVTRCGTAPVALVVNGRRCDGPGPTVVDCTRTPPVVRRVGMLPESYVDGVMMMAAFQRRRWFSMRKSPGIAGS